MSAIKITFFALLTVSILSACTNEQPAKDSQQMVLDTDHKKVSYAVGRNIGDSLKKSGLEIDIDILTASVAEALAGNPDRLTDAEKMEVSTAMQKQQSEHANKITNENKSEGAAFLTANAEKEGVTVLPSGLQYRIITPGTGKKPSSTDSVTVHYRGTLIDGTEFDSSYKRGQPATFPVSGVIKGWIEALQLMKEGAKWQLFIPPDLAYGERGAGANIGPHATLLFEVELIKINE